MWANDYIAVPFLEKGRSHAGCDCWGLGQLIYREQRGIELPGYEELYENTRDKATLERIIFEERQARWRQVTDPKEFDFALLRMGGVPMHVGIVTKPGKMIHCAKDTNTVHEKYTGLKWQHNVMGFYRYE